MDKKEIKAKKIKFIYLIPVIIIVTPILLGLLLNIPGGKLTIGDEGSWVGFFGNYSGGIIGGLVAYVVAKQQFNQGEIKRLKINKELERVSLLRVRFELTKTKEEFILLSKTEEDVNEANQPIPFVDLVIRELNSLNWSKASNISDESLLYDLMELEDFYCQFRGTLLVDIHNLEIQKNRLEEQLSFLTKDNPEWWELKERFISISNSIIVEKRRREYHWKDYRKKRIEIDQLIEKVDLLISDS